MSRWFGGSSSSSSSTTSNSSGSGGGSDFNSSSFSSSYDGSNSSFEDSSFGDFGSSLSANSGGTGSSSTTEQQLQHALLQEQQRVQVQQAIAKLTALCFDKCVGKPDAKLSSSEQSCIVNTAERYLDTSMFVMGRLMKQQGGK